MYTRTKRWVAAVLLGAGLTTVTVACQSHPDQPAQKVRAAAWATDNYASISAATEAAQVGDLTQASHDFDAITTPPVDSKDWNRARGDLAHAAFLTNKGDLADALTYGVEFNQDVSNWLVQFEKYVPDAVNGND